MPYGLTFATPLVLLTLAALPVLLVAYVVHERGRPRAAARFGNPSLLPNLVPRRPRWRRHIAPLIVGVAIAALVVAAARPQRAVSKPRRQATVVLVVDTSRSMSATDVRPTRLAAATSAARVLVAALPPDGRVGVVGFSRVVNVLNSPTDDRSVIDASLGRLQIGGGTAMGDALTQAIGLAKQGGQAQGGKPAAAIVVLSDGATTEGKVSPLAAARAAKAAHIPVYTVSLGTAQGTVVNPSNGKTIPVPPDPASLRRVAAAAGGQSYTVADAARLRQVYGSIGKRVGTQRQVQDMGFAFVGGAGALVLLAAFASLGWFRRLTF